MQSVEQQVEPLLPIQSANADTLGQLGSAPYGRRREYGIRDHGGPRAFAVRQADASSLSLDNDSVGPSVQQVHGRLP